MWQCNKEKQQQIERELQLMGLPNKAVLPLLHFIGRIRSSVGICDQVDKSGSPVISTILVDIEDNST